MIDINTALEPIEDEQCYSLTGNGRHACTLNAAHIGRCLQHDTKTGEALYGWRTGAFMAFPMNDRAECDILPLLEVVEADVEAELALN